MRSKDALICTLAICVAWAAPVHADQSPVKSTSTQRVQSSPNEETVQVPPSATKDKTKSAGHRPGRLSHFYSNEPSPGYLVRYRHRYSYGRYNRSRAFKHDPFKDGVHMYPGGHYIRVPLHGVRIGW